MRLKEFLEASGFGWNAEEVYVIQTQVEEWLTQFSSEYTEARKHDQTHRCVPWLEGYGECCCTSAARKAKER